jgi:hypothetical protein
MQPNVLAKLRELQTLASSRGIQTTVLSGFRTRQDQEELYANYIAGLNHQPLPYPERGAVPLAAKPGTSLHEKGLAFDLEAADKSRQGELRSLGETIGLHTLGSSDPDHFDMASGQAGQDGQPSMTPGASSVGGDTALGRKYAAYLIDKGYTPEAAAGIVGNAFQENNLIPGGRGGDNGLSVGMFQWHDSADGVQHRGKDFESWLQANNRDINDYRSHLDYADYDLRKNYPEVYKKVMAAQNSGDAANIIMTGYEVPAAATANLKRRVDFANALTGGTVPAVAGGGGADLTASGGGGKSDWSSLLGASEPPSALSDLGSVLGGAVGGGGTAPAYPGAGVMDVADSVLPRIDFSYAPASTSPEELGARYAMGKESRKLTTLGDLFTIGNVGMAQPKYMMPQTGGRIA